MIDAGKLDQRITLQRKAVTKNALGEETVTWADVDTVWAFAEPLRGREFFSAEQMQSEVTTRFTLRWRPDIEVTMRVLWKGQPFDVQAVINRLGRDALLELMCAAGVRDGR